MPGPPSTSGGGGAEGTAGKQQAVASRQSLTQVSSAVFYPPQGVANRDLKLENLLLDRPTTGLDGDWPLLKVGGRAGAGHRGTGCRCVAAVPACARQKPTSACTHLLLAPSLSLPLFPPLHRSATLATRNMSSTAPPRRVRGGCRWLGPWATAVGCADSLPFMRLLRLLRTRPTMLLPAVSDLFLPQAWARRSTWLPRSSPAAPNTMRSAPTSGASLGCFCSRAPAAALLLPPPPRCCCRRSRQPTARTPSLSPLCLLVHPTHSDRAGRAASSCSSSSLGATHSRLATETLRGASRPASGRCRPRRRRCRPSAAAC